MNPWEAGTTYTPASGMGSAFNWGLNGMPQGLSQRGVNGVGAGLRAFGQSQMGAGGLGGSTMMQNPGMAFGAGLQNGQRAMPQQPQPQPEPQSQEGGGGGGMYWGGILPGLLGGKFGGATSGGQPQGAFGSFDIKKLFGGFG